jgi:endoglucanase
MELLWTGGCGPPDLRRGGRAVVAMLTMCAAALALAAATAQAGTANGGLPGARDDPIGHMTWGTPHDDDLWNAYQSASGADQALLGKLALQPRAVWLGSWDPSGQVRTDTAATVADTRNGAPNALTEFATFELNPWEQQTVGGSWKVGADEAWYRSMAAGIGSARAMVIEQVDLPFARKTSSTAPERIDIYAARVLSAEPHTTVYIDGGTHGWLTAAQDAELMIRNGIRYARGFALDDTDYDATATEDKFGAQVVAALAKLGVTGKHFIVDTDENGQPYEPDQVPGKAINNTPMCHDQIQTVCQRTGIPPTTNVESSQWHLGTLASKAAKRYCDGYVWSGRPWDINAGPLSLQNALWLAANGEY